MKNKANYFLEYQKPLVLLLGVFLLSNGFYYQGVYTGYGYAAVNLAGICYPMINGLCIYDADPYQDVSNVYVYAHWIVAVYIIIKLLDFRWWSKVVSILLLAVLLVIQIGIFRFKAEAMIDPDRYLDLFRLTAGSDWIAIAITVLLLLLEAASLRWKKVPAG